MQTISKLTVGRKRSDQKICLEGFLGTQVAQRFRAPSFIHPPKPTVGIRASQPNQIWHVDTSVIKLLDGMVDRRLTRCSSGPAPKCPRNCRWRRAMRGPRALPPIARCPASAVWASEPAFRESKFRIDSRGDAVANKKFIMSSHTAGRASRSGGYSPCLSDCI